MGIYAAALGNSLIVSQNVKHITTWPTNSTSRAHTHPKEKNICPIYENCPKTCFCITHSIESFNNKKKVLIHAIWMNFEKKCHFKWKNLITKKHMMTFIWMCRVAKSTETKSRLVIHKDWGGNGQMVGGKGQKGFRFKVMKMF